MEEIKTLLKSNVDGGLKALHAATMALKSCAEYIYTSSRNGRTSILIGLQLVHFWLV